MDRLKKSRRPVRGQVTRLVNKITTQLAADQPDLDIVSSSYELLQETMATMAEWDRQIIDQMLDDDETDENVDKEYEAIESVKETFLILSRKVNKLLNVPATSEADFETASNLSSSVKDKRQYKLPKVELRKFTGEIKDWIGWWSQFEIIHNDADLNPVDKFQYLAQSIKTDTEAAEIVNTYPMSETMYEEAVTALKERFGREDLLLQVYVRELLTLVITNVTTKQKIPLSSLYLKLESHLRALATLQLKTADPETWLFPLVESSLSEDTLRAWQRSSYSKTDGSKVDPPKSRLDYLMEFIKFEVQSDQQIKLAQQGFKSVTVSSERKTRDKKSMFQEDVATAAGLFNSAKETCCVFCDKKHESERCFKAQNMTLEDKKLKIKEKNACYQCLRVGHSAKKCFSGVKCLVCHKKHLPIICPSLSSSSSSKEPSQDAIPDQEVKTASAKANQCAGDVLLCAIMVKMETRNGNITVRLVGDSGNQRSYIRSHRVHGNCNKVGSEWLRNELFGAITTAPQRYEKYSVILKSLNEEKSIRLDLLAKPVISGLLPKVPYGPWIQKLASYNIHLNDVGEGYADVDILLGNNLWGTIITGQQKSLGGGLYATETIFGWTLGGPVGGSSSAAMTVTSMLSTSQEISKLWSLESLGITDSVEKANECEIEKAALDHFQNTINRDEVGRYIVSLPWKAGKESLPTNRIVAETRLRKTTFKLKKNSKWHDYDMVFRDWEKQEIITEVEDLDTGHFLCHRPVYKENSSTPTRPVFDASCRHGNSPSLNDCLYKGPNQLEQIPSILLRFREKKIGVTADIKKVFLTMKVRNEDCEFQKFLWWTDDRCSKVKVYKLNRVTFGINCSPFLLSATINHHLLNVTKNKDICKQLMESYYVDNVATSVNSIAEFFKFKQVATEVMNEACMELRQWAYTFDGKYYNTEPEVEQKSIMPVLGLLWDRSDDTLSCAVQPWEATKITKREILSVVAKSFDPIGFCCPALVPTKTLIQEAWVNKLGWDEPVPDELANKFSRWLYEHDKLKQVKIARQFQLETTNRKEVHVMCDASQTCYASVVYMLTENEQGVNVQLLLGKSRLSPLKKSTIPRLELLSCWIGTCLAKVVRESLNCDQIPFYFWSDSTTALAWIRRNGDWGTFVGNRVKKILMNSDAAQWFHVPGSHNPADLPSRGCSPAELLKSRWWEGPVWMKQNKSEWPSPVCNTDEDEVNRERKKQVSSLKMSVFKVSQPKFSSYRSNVAVWGWVSRFIKRCREKAESRKFPSDTGFREVENTSFLTIKELREGEKILIRSIQHDAFPSSATVINGIMVSKDKDGIYTVETKLLNRIDTDDFKRPALLPNSHPLVELLIKDLHKFHGHAGSNFMVTRLREKYWILQCKRAVQKVIHKCTICRRFDAKSVEVHAAALPEARVKTSEAFETTGVDLAGPLFLKDGSKVWITLFTCAVYRCVYLDLVSSLSTEAFLRALERFICAHGRPNTVYSDNGTNFVGAVNIFKQLDWRAIELSSNAKQIQWVFNPPTAAWWGGWWERLVRTVKDLLRRMLGKSKLTYDELRTCLSGVTATINDRPLTVITGDKEMMTALTPAMFMRGRGYGHLPEGDAVLTLPEAYKRMKRIQHQLQDRFRKEYLSLLVMRGNEKKKRELQVGEMVLVGADNRKRYEWPVGVIVELIPGADGKVRVAKVRTASGVLVRPFQRLYPLEVKKEDAAYLGNLDSVVTDVKKKTETTKASDANNKSSFKTKRGRICKPPVRYTSYFNLII